ncbi:hypothetical protein PTE30175_00275 [Pandoraea terrae]|uniref:Tir chaperone family protein n=2 Tax=Pandoraea terrae TaxID=1537710 RepID=A0A5E4RNQ6_9BURK|nr:hypothetical protein PTE30175_00275 [Pandoraea terrae]
MFVADQLLLNLGRMAGFPEPLRFDGRGCARLMFDDRLAVDLECTTDTGCMQVYTVLGTLPVEGREAFFLQLLEANLFVAETAGATLAVDGETNEVVLCRTVELDEIGDGAFVRLIERFVGAAEYWKSRLAP